MKGDRPGYKAYNDALRKWRVTGRALELNQDVSTHEYSAGEAIIQGLGFDEVEKEAIAFEDAMGEAGKVRKDNEFTRWNDSTRNWRSGTETVKVIGTIAGSVWLTKKIPIGVGKNIGGIMTHWKRRATVGALRNLPVRNALIDGIVTTGIAGAAEVVSLAAAEPIQQEIFGGDPFIFNTRTGEVHPEGIVFAFTLGTMGPITQGFLKTVAKNPAVKGALFAADDFARKYNVIGASTMATFGRKALEAGVGTVTLLAAEYASGMHKVDYNSWKELNYASEAEMRQKYGWEHLKNNYFALFAYGAMVPGKNNTGYKLYEGMRSDLARYQGTTKYAKDGAKVLGLKQPSSKNRYTTEEINKTFREKVTEVENDPNLSVKERNEKIEKLKKAAEDMHFDNEMTLVNDMIKQEDIDREERQEVFNLYLKRKNGEKLTAKEKEDFGNLTEKQLDYFKAKLGIVSKDYNRKALGLDKEIRDSDASKYIDQTSEHYKNVLRHVMSQKVHTDPKAKAEAINKIDELYTIQSKINKYEGNKSPFAKSQLKELKEEFERKVEEINGVIKKFDKLYDFKSELSRKLLEKASEELGEKVRFIDPTNKEQRPKETDKQYKERINKEIQENFEKEGFENDPFFDPNSTAFHIKGKNGEPDIMVVNPLRAKGVGTLGAGIHEWGHHILRDAYKERYFEYKGKEYTMEQLQELKTTNKRLYNAISKIPYKERISDHGIDVIDNFLLSLSRKERRILEESMGESYFWKTVPGSPKLSFSLKGLDIQDTFKRVKKDKSEYYEEYLTHYLQALKDGAIKSDRGAVSKMGDIVIPKLQKYGFPNAGRGKKEGNEKYSIDNVKGLKKLLNDIYAAGERGTSKYKLQKFMRDNAVKVAEGYEAYNEISYSKFPEMEKINKLAEGNYKELLNEKIEGTDKNKYTKKEAGEIWKKEWRGPDSDPTAGRWKEVYDKIASNIFDVVLKQTGEFNRRANGIITQEAVFAWDVVQELGGLRENQIKIGGHVRNFDITKKVYEKKDADFGLSGWVNDFASLKLLNVLKTSKDLVKDPREKYLSEEEMRGLIDPDAVDIIESKASSETNRRIVLESEKLKLHEVMTQLNRVKGNQAKGMHDSVREFFMTTNAKGERVINIEKLAKYTEGKNYKTLPGLMLPETIRFFVGEAKNKKGKLIHKEIARKIKEAKNLSKEDIAAAQRGLDKFMSVIHEYVIPEGYITKEVKYIDKKGEPASMQVPGGSTGVPKTILRITHTKRSIAGETTLRGKKVRTKENFFAHRKKDITVEVEANLREAVGLNKDGTRNLSPRNIKKNGKIITKGVGEEIKNIFSLTDRLFTSQPIREMLMEQGRVFEATMLTGYGTNRQSS